VGARNPLRGQAGSGTLAIIPLCEFHHSVGKFQDGRGLNKRINRDIAMRRAMENDRKKYPLLKWRKSGQP